MENEYYFSGTLEANHSTYVKRKADKDLLEYLLQGNFCYVLSTRQSGKSSLCNKTVVELLQHGVVCVQIDLSGFSSHNTTEEGWYLDLIGEMVDKFGLDIEIDDWWKQNINHSCLYQLTKFIEDILLTEFSQNIVIFIDEIDCVLDLKFSTDEFFGFIRFCYNKRVNNPKYNRLTFCLAGVASPSDLIKNKKRTPFNIGKAIDLEGFKLDEMEPLRKGLESKYSDSQAVIQSIWFWTRGQPFLTQKICQKVLDVAEKRKHISVEQVVKSGIIDNWECEDKPQHLITIQNLITRSGERRAIYLLELYQQVLLAQEFGIPLDNSQAQSELLLSGIVAKQQNNLIVYNPIYKKIFDLTWIKKQLENLRPYSENLRAWLASGKKDDSRLLRGNALKEAMKWMNSKNSYSQDEEFLRASQIKESREIELAYIGRAIIVLFSTILIAMLIVGFTATELNLLREEIGAIKKELNQLKTR